MNAIDWINSIKGKPWEDRKSGPDTYDCWGVVVDSFVRIDNNPLHEVAGYVSGAPISDAGAAEESSDEWQEIADPEDGAVFCVYDNAAMVHVGRIFHILKAGLYAVHSRGEGGQVRVDKLRVINKVYADIKYFRRVA